MLAGRRIVDIVAFVASFLERRVAGSIQNSAEVCV